MNWHDIKEEGETFDYETEEEARSTCEACEWRTGSGYKINYREVSDREQEQERASYAASMAAMM
jgi:hypothetical protein